MSSTPTLTLNVESGILSPYSVSVPLGYNFAAIHQAQAEIVFEYATSQTSFSLSGVPETDGGFEPLSNIRFFSGTAGVPEPATWAMLLMGFAGLGFAAFRRSGKTRLEGLAA